MTKPKPKVTCDIHGGVIDSEKSYTFEVYEGSPWSKTQIKGQNIDCCHKCFLDICKQGYVPQWKTTVKNPKYTKTNDEPYRVELVETDVHIGQEEQKLIA